MIDCEPLSFTAAGLDRNGASKDDDALIGSVGPHDADIFSAYIAFNMIILFHSDPSLLRLQISYNTEWQNIVVGTPSVLS